MSKTLWIWNATTWPELTFQAERLTQSLKSARSEVGRLFGKAEAIGATDLADVEREVWSGEAISTAAIEGEILNLASVRSSIARRLGITAEFTAAVPRNVEGLLDVMENAAADWDADLTKERLCRWQAALFPAEGTTLRHIETGRFRTHEDPMQIVSGRMGKEHVHYVAPPSAAVPAEMHTFLKWFNGTRAGQRSRARGHFPSMVRIHPSIRRRERARRPSHSRSGAGSGRQTGHATARGLQ